MSRTRPPAFVEALAAEIDADLVPMGSAGVKVLSVARDVYSMQDRLPSSRMGTYALFRSVLADAREKAGDPLAGVVSGKDRAIVHASDATDVRTITQEAAPGAGKDLQIAIALHGLIEEPDIASLGAKRLPMILGPLGPTSDPRALRLPGRLAAAGHTVALAAGILVWDLVVRINDIQPYVLPSPGLVFRTLIADWAILWESLLVTLTVTFQALILAFVGGVALAIAFNKSRLVEYSFYPYAVILQVTPVVAIAPLLLIYLPQHAAVLACAWIVAFFPVLANTTLGLNSADRNLAALFELCGASRWQILWSLKLPSALPQILTGLRIAGGLSLIGAVVAEIAAGSAGAGSGLAYRIAESGYRLNIPRMFAALRVSSPCSVYFRPPWMMPCEATVCPAPRAPVSTSSVRTPRAESESSVHRPAAPPPKTSTSNATAPLMRASCPIGRVGRAPPLSPATGPPVPSVPPVQAPPCGIAVW